MCWVQEYVGFNVSKVLDEPDLLRWLQLQVILPVVTIGISSKDKTTPSIRFRVHQASIAELKTSN
jgi:hypothetical protein